MHRFLYPFRWLKHRFGRMARIEMLLDAICDSNRSMAIESSAGRTQAEDEDWWAGQVAVIRSNLIASDYKLGQINNFLTSLATEIEVTETRANTKKRAVKKQPAKRHPTRQRR